MKVLGQETVATGKLKSSERFHDRGRLAMSDTDCAQLPTVRQLASWLESNFTSASISANSSLFMQMCTPLAR